MYLYFTQDGTLKEIINNNAFRVGNAYVNYLYVYWDKVETDITGLDYRFMFDDGSKSSTGTTYTIVNDYVPTDKKRDYKYFKEGKLYRFYKIDPTNLIIGKTGSVIGSIFLHLDNNETLALNKISFYVENGVYSNDKDENINAIQWNALIHKLDTDYTDAIQEAKDYTDEKTKLYRHYIEIEYYTQAISLRFNIASFKEDMSQKQTFCDYLNGCKIRVSADIEDYNDGQVILSYDDTTHRLNINWLGQDEYDLDVNDPSWFYLDSEVVEVK